MRRKSATLRDAMDVIKLVQVSDFIVGTRDTPNRVVPGDGDIPLRRILGDVLRAGYDGAFDLELIGPRIEEEGYESAIRAYTKALTLVPTAHLAFAGVGFELVGADRCFAGAHVGVARDRHLCFRAGVVFARGRFGLGAVRQKSADVP